MLFRLTANRPWCKDREMEVPLNCVQTAQWLEGGFLDVIAPHLTYAQYEFLLDGGLPVNFDGVCAAMCAMGSPPVTLCALNPGDVFTVVGQTAQYMFIDHRSRDVCRVADRNFKLHDLPCKEAVQLVEAPCQRSQPPTHASRIAPDGRSTTGSAT